MDFLYVCLFSNGYIKVGRSIDPTARIAQHVERVACVGIELADHFTVRCASSTQQAEADLISCCAGYPGSRRFASEWFSGLAFDIVCAWAQTFADKEYASSGTTPLREFLDTLPRGSLGEFAARLGLTGTVYLQQLASRQDGREPSPQLCVCIERETRLQVRRWHLRPTDWHSIWPELIGQPGAPAVNTFSAPDAGNFGGPPPMGAASGPPA